MKVGLRCGLVAAAAAAVHVPSSSWAAGITKEQCADTNQQAQDLRRDGRLAAAHAKLQQCSDPVCPGIVRDDCVQRLDEIERAQPTIVFDAKDGDGHDLIAVKVTVDGAPLAEKLEGRALRVDPGAHTFAFTAAGSPTVTATFVLKEGEKERRERIVIGATAKASPLGPSASSASSPPLVAASTGWTTTRWVGVTLAGAGVIGLGVGSVFGLLTGSAWSSAKEACGGDTSHCRDVAGANTDRSTALSDSTISAIGFAAGGALLVGGAVLFFAGANHDASTTGIVVAPAVAPGQGGVAIRGSF